MLKHVRFLTEVRDDTSRAALRLAISAARCRSQPINYGGFGTGRWGAKWRQQKRTYISKEPNCEEENGNIFTQWRVAC